MRFTTLVSIIIRNIEVFARQALKKSPRPYKLLLELTENCNSRCLTCSIWKNEPGVIKREFSLEDANSLFSSYGHNLLWLSLSGGEITLYKKFPELIQLIKKYCPKLKIITFTTNGLNPEKTLRYADHLKSLNCDTFITVSLDGDEHTHDYIRGIPGNFQRAQNTFYLLKNEGLQVYWGITLSEHNKKFIQSNNYLIKEIKAVTFAHNNGIYKQQNSSTKSELSESMKVVLSKYKIQSLSEAFEWLYIKLSTRFLNSDKSTLIPCEVISTNLHIKASGDIHPCMFVPAIGSINQSSLKKLMDSAVVQEKMIAYRKGKCPGCWMNCYAPHSMMQNPIRSIFRAITT